MKIIILILSLGSTALACNPKSYEGDVALAQSLMGQALDCTYNGLNSPGTLSVAVPRCPGANPMVTLETFGDKLTVTQIEVLRESKPVQYKFTTEQVDGELVCTL